MSSCGGIGKCEGRGNCFLECSCDCFDDDDYQIPSLECSCGKRDHIKFNGGDTDSDFYCQTECLYKCKLIECYNFRFCGKKMPQMLLDCHNEMCPMCAIYIGKIKFLDIKEDCPICMDNKDIIQLSCDGKHKLCIDCWKKIAEMDGPNSSTCPICREAIWWRKSKNS